MLPGGRKKGNVFHIPPGGRGCVRGEACQKEQTLMQHGLKGEYPFVTHKVSKASYATGCKQWKKRHFKRPPQTSGAAADGEGTVSWEGEKEKVIKSQADELHL